MVKIKVFFALIRHVIELLMEINIRTYHLTSIPMNVRWCIALDLVNNTYKEYLLTLDV